MYCQRVPLVTRSLPSGLMEIYNIYGVKRYEGAVLRSAWLSTRYKSPTVKGDFIRPTTWGIVTQVHGHRFYNYESWRRGERYVYTNAHVETARLNFPGSVFGINGYLATVTMNVPAWAVAHAETQISTNIRNLHANLAESFAESAKTATFITDTAGKLARVVMLVRKGKFAKAAKLLGLDKVKDLPETASSAWLQWQYAVKPLLADVDVAIDLYNNSLTESAHQVRLRGSWKETRSFSKTDSLGNPVEYSEDLKYRYQGIYEIDEIELAGAAMLGLSSPLALAWALTPWSFLVDMFLPVADWINSQYPLAGCTYIGGHVSVSGGGFSRFPKGASVGGVNRPVSPVLVSGYLRQAIGTPRPHVYFKNPFLNLTSASSIAALIISQSSRNNPVIRNG